MDDTRVDALLVKMRRFAGKNPSPKFRAAVEALLVLKAERKEGMGAVEAAFGVVAAPSRKTRWRRGTLMVGVQWRAPGALRLAARYCLHQLLGEPCEGGESYAPGGVMDHGTLWNYDGEPYCLVGQPYEVSWAGLQELVDFCRAHNLVAMIDGSGSWHAPGRTVRVRIERAGKTAVPAPA